MLKYSKLSQYKIKKILKCFVEDYTSTEASKLTKLSRNTIDKYYKKFRCILQMLAMTIFTQMHIQDYYIGCISCECESKSYINVYKISEKHFMLTKRIKKNGNEKKLLYDEDFEKFRHYANKRYSKFYGLSVLACYSQLLESTFKYAYTQEELFDLIWNNLTKNDITYKLPLT